MCDTLCLLGDGVTLFAKNSDRPRSEPQIASAFPRRPPGGSLRTQYLDIPDTGAFSTLLSRPTWLWGAEHGLNEHRVAIGNEMVFTTVDPRPLPPAFIGMDLVRLGLERGRTADAALEAITTLIDHHGQGGIGDQIHSLSYWSSFLIADPASAWILDTSASSWAARQVDGAAAISNCLTLRTDWTRASADIVPGTDIGSWRHPGLPTGFADTRLESSGAFLRRAAAVPDCDPRAVVGLLRDHGSGPWGVPGSHPRLPSAGSSDPSVPAAPAVDDASLDGAGWTVCLHANETAVTTASLLALLPTDPDVPARAWMALGSPCVSVYVPVPPPLSGTAVLPVPPLVGDEEFWIRFAAIRDCVGLDATSLAAVRAELSPLEDALWDEATDLGTDPEKWQAYGARATRRVSAALDALAAAGIGVSDTDR
ncbi:MAG TPA: hypothetical protein VNC61_01925 [Acidimicrobiales bacterium]|nr:hypothetical protein [Acidimicrobiales bacterium]